jgi:hypothetical protein
MLENALYLSSEDVQVNQAVVASIVAGTLILAMISTSQAFGNMIDSSREQMVVDVAAEDVTCNKGKSEIIRSDNAICIEHATTTEETSGKHDARQNILKVKVVDRKTKSPISDSTVIVAKTSGKIVVWKITDKNGTQQLDVPSGDYYIILKASCCYSKMERLHIRGDMEKIFELVDR